MTARAWGSDFSNCSGLTIRSQKRVTGLKVSAAVIVGSPNCSTCWSTGSTILWAYVSPLISKRGRRFVMATPAAVTMLVHPGPMDDVATMICLRRLALG